jgi:hypothetical protein
MDKNFTPENLVQLLYSEVSNDEAGAMRQAINSNPQLQEEYTDLREAYEALPKAKFSPSRTAIQNILRYSEQSTVIV